MAKHVVGTVDEIPPGGRKIVISETAGEYEYSRQGEILRCPWHGWEFDVRTGESWFDPAKVCVLRYQVTVEPEGAAATAEVSPAPGLEPSPYVAETYAVTVERRNVVVDVPG